MKLVVTTSRFVGGEFTGATLERSLQENKDRGLYMSGYTNYNPGFDINGGSFSGSDGDMDSKGNINSFNNFDGDVVGKNNTNSFNGFDGAVVQSNTVGQNNNNFFGDGLVGQDNINSFGNGVGNIVQSSMSNMNNYNPGFDISGGISGGSVQISGGSLSIDGKKVTFSGRREATEAEIAKEVKSIERHVEEMKEAAEDMKRSAEGMTYGKEGMLTGAEGMVAGNPAQIKLADELKKGCYIFRNEEHNATCLVPKSKIGAGESIEDCPGHLTVGNKSDLADILEEDTEELVYAFSGRISLLAFFLW